MYHIVFFEKGTHNEKKDVKRSFDACVGTGPCTVRMCR